MRTCTVWSAPEITALAKRICAGEVLDSATARALLDVVPGSAEQDALLAAARRVREHFKGNQVHCCSILNAKAGNCSEDCSYCSQASGAANSDYQKHKWMDDGEILQAAESAAANGAKALSLVAAWKGVKEGTQLDMVVESVKRLASQHGVRADVNLGILESQTCADRLKEAGVKVYGHNLETARSHFQETCKTHTFEERLKTIEYIKQAGMGLCSGGIFGLGENKDQRVEFLEQLRYIEPDMIPINFINPLPGTGLEGKPLVQADEALITLAVTRLFLPDRNLMVAGGKEVTFGERLAEVFDAGINAIMVGNYLTTMGTSPQWWKDQLAARGLEVAPEDAVHGSSCGH